MNGFTKPGRWTTIPFLGAGAAIAVLTFAVHGGFGSGPVLHVPTAGTTQVSSGYHVAPSNLNGNGRLDLISESMESAGYHTTPGAMNGNGRISIVK